MPCGTVVCGMQETKKKTRRIAAAVPPALMIWGSGSTAAGK